LKFLDWPSVFELLPTDIEHVQVYSMEYGAPMILTDWNVIGELEKLKTLGTCVRGPFDVEEARLIPRTVQTLLLHSFQVPPNTDWCTRILEALPQNLTRLEGVWPGRISADRAQSLPKLLEMVETTVSYEAVPRLPKNFKALEISGFDFDPEFDASMTFPASLIRLSIPKLSVTLADKLPNGLQIMTIGEILLTPQTLEKLPKNLTSLFIDDALCEVQELEPLLKSLPPNLTSLCMPQLCLLGGARVATQAPPGSSRIISRRMRKLELPNLDFPNLSEWILGLPTTLKRLMLRINNLEKDGLKSLIHLHSLDELRIKVSSSPKDGWAQCLKFRFLPRQLGTLHVFDMGRVTQDSNLTDESFIEAPPRLHWVALPRSPLVTEKCLVHLPNLARLVFPGRNAPTWFNNEVEFTS
jgi:hypothetical protein